MVQDMYNMEADCIFYVDVGTFDQLEQNKICILTITQMGILILTVQHDLIFIVSSFNIPGISRDKHHQMPFPSKNFLPNWDNHEISAVVNLYGHL